ncbi:MAG TPA: AbrB/MazE/SpoVT family DNA-binding domain-containing protein [Caulobacteraceae bacterium]|jgi:antitoxin VapB
MTTVTSRTFKSGNSQAVRLPKDVAFDGDVDVTIVRSGDVLTIYPKRPSIADMLAKLDALPGPGEIEVRDADVVPDRPGL